MFVYLFPRHDLRAHRRRSASFASPPTQPTQGKHRRSSVPTQANPDAEEGTDAMVQPEPARSEVPTHSEADAARTPTQTDAELPTQFRIPTQADAAACEPGVCFALSVSGLRNEFPTETEYVSALPKQPKQKLFRFRVVSFRLRFRRPSLGRPAASPSPASPLSIP